MAELVPYPFGRLVRRMFRELDAKNTVFDYPMRKLVKGPGARDYSVGFHDARASTPLGPAAGPQSQLAQNVVLSFLGGGRIVELKTVQILDELKIPRPCIDMQTVGYNVEWSQELKLEQSLQEYVKASMLVDILVASGELGLQEGFDRVVYDMSVGYDLAGIQTERVQAFMRGMLDATDIVDRLRAEIPDEHRIYRDLDFRTKLSDTLTLSTFHGCPPDEIEKIIDWLLRTHRLDCIVKLNPTLLGPARVRELLNERLGYADHVPDSAFDKDTKWEQAEAFVGRLGETAASVGRGFGVKFSNTLIVENRRDFFPETEKEMYLSGQPLHVLAMSLVGRFRQAFGDRFPISFSAGIDKDNFAEAVALGLVPVTVCSDLLRKGGYARMHGYLQRLGARMDEVGATDVDGFVLRAMGNASAALGRAKLDDEARTRCREALDDGGDLRAAAGDAWDRWVSEAKLLNTEAYVQALLDDPRYARAANDKTPKKVGTTLELFDCLTCDICVPVCPNDANFTYTLPNDPIPVVKVTSTTDGWEHEHGEPLQIGKRHQIANFADFCNECGNCDVFCPEDGGPYVLKPRFFGSREQFELYPTHDGFFVDRHAGADTVLGRFSGDAYALSVANGRATFGGDGFELRFDESDPESTLEGRAEGTVDLTFYYIMTALRRALLDGDEVHYVNA